MAEREDFAAAGVGGVEGVGIGVRGQGLWGNVDLSVGGGR